MFVILVMLQAITNMEFIVKYALFREYKRLFDVKVHVVFVGYMYFAMVY